MLALSGTGGLLLHEKDVTTAMEEISEYLTNNILAIDTEIKDYITTDMIVNYLGYFQDPEGDPLYEGQWEYEYDPHIFTEEAGKGQLITRKESEPITTFTDIGAYAIRFKVRDNPVGENDDLDEYRKWSDTKEYERLLLVQTRPTAKVQTKVVKNPNDKNSVLATVTYESEDADHRNDSKKGIRKEYFYYKSSKDSDWTEGKLPNKLPIGETFLVKYVAKDMEGSYSFPAVVVI